MYDDLPNFFNEKVLDTTQFIPIETEDCETKNVPNNTIEQILGQNIPKCCGQEGYIFQKFRKVCRYSLTLACLKVS